MEMNKMGQYPRISVSEEIKEIQMVYGQTFTLWLKEKGKEERHQVEVRITEDGLMEVFVNKNDSPIEIKDFGDWKPI